MYREYFCASSNKKEKSNPKHFYKVYQTEKKHREENNYLIVFFSGFPSTMLLYTSLVQ